MDYQNQFQNQQKSKITKKPIKQTKSMNQSNKQPNKSTNEQTNNNPPHKPPLAHHLSSWTISRLSTLADAISIMQARSSLVNPLFSSSRQSRLELVLNIPNTADSLSDQWITQMSGARRNAFLMYLQHTQTDYLPFLRQTPKKLALEVLFMSKRIYCLIMRNRGRLFHFAKNLEAHAQILGGTWSFIISITMLMISWASGISMIISIQSLFWFRNDKPAPFTRFCKSIEEPYQFQQYPFISFTRSMAFFAQENLSTGDYFYI